MAANSPEGTWIYNAAHAAGKKVKTAPGSTQGLTPGQLVNQGQEAEKTNALARAARSILTKGFWGFDLGIGMMQNIVTPQDLLTMRNTLTTLEDQVAYDTALAFWIGFVKHNVKA